MVINSTILGLQLFPFLALVGCFSYISPLVMRINQYVQLLKIEFLLVLLWTLWSCGHLLKCSIDYTKETCMLWLAAIWNVLFELLVG